MMFRRKAMQAGSANARLALTADPAKHFVLSLRRPDWEVAYDMDGAKAAETRKRVFDMIAAERIPFIGYHYVPAAYQFRI
jgi:hypothetical protein